jgi:hypothetical protein
VREESANFPNTPQVGNPRAVVVRNEILARVWRDGCARVGPESLVSPLLRHIDKYQVTGAQFSKLIGAKFKKPIPSLPASVQLDALRRKEEMMVIRCPGVSYPTKYQVSSASHPCSLMNRGRDRIEMKPTEPCRAGIGPVMR